jgi:hypothetical protein
MSAVPASMAIVVGPGDGHVIGPALVLPLLALVLLPFPLVVALLVPVPFAALVLLPPGPVGLLTSVVQPWVVANTPIVTIEASET